MYQRILVPLDGSPLAARALPHALQIARCMESELHLARVSLAAVYLSSPLVDGPVFTEEMMEADRLAAEAYLSKVKAELNYPEVPVTTTVLTGAVAEALIDYAHAQNVDLIVMSTHGRSGLSRWVLGSVAEKVLRGAHCPTLIVRGQPED